MRREIPNRILLVDCALITDGKLAPELCKAGFSVALTNSCQEAALLLGSLKADMVILGHISEECLDTCRQLRSLYQVPLIMIGNDLSKDIWHTAMLDSVVDLYMRSPFSIEALIPKIKVVLRRYLSPEPRQSVHAPRDISKELAYASQELPRIQPLHRGSDDNGSGW